MGKPSGTDLQLGIASGPALFTWEEHPQSGPLIERKLTQEATWNWHVILHYRIDIAQLTSHRVKGYRLNEMIFGY
jgi:geranylgeranyl pyrophosphate synthase